ncbi:MAG: heavy-metal-associated domain-containing protein [Alphaproteobacteria bacterium]|nr:heavy-metal-associated domain-containing protein [Alphaproteobacteria bacterium]
MLSISGMTCDGCAKTVTRILSRVPGVSSAKVDFATNRAVVTGSAHLDVLIAAVQAAGYGAQPMGSDTIERGQNERSGSGCC